MPEREELTRQLRRLLHRQPGDGAGLPRVPAGHAGAPLEIIQERLRNLETDVAEVRARVNGLLFLVAGAVVVQLLSRLGG